MTKKEEEENNNQDKKDKDNYSLFCLYIYIFKNSAHRLRRLYW